MELDNGSTAVSRSLTSRRRRRDMATQTDPLPEPVIERVLVPVPIANEDPMEVSINEAVAAAAEGTPLKENKHPKQAQLSKFFEAPVGYTAPPVVKLKKAKKITFALTPAAVKPPKTKTKVKKAKTTRKKSKYAFGERKKPIPETIDLVEEDMEEEPSTPPTQIVDPLVSPPRAKPRPGMYRRSKPLEECEVQAMATAWTGQVLAATTQDDWN